MKHHSKVQELVKQSSDLSENDNQLQLDVLNRQDILEQLVLTEILDDNKQMSILNKVNFELIVEMPGI
jgi:hypothetical protein